MTFSLDNFNDILLLYHLLALWSVRENIYKPEELDM